MRLRTYAIGPTLYLMAVFGLISACDSRSLSPTPIPKAPLAIDLEVSGDTRLPAVGAVSQFTATATLNDGSRRDVTTDAVWIAVEPSVAVVVAPGMVRARRLGRGTVAVGYPPFRKKLSIEVRPPGTFTLTGLVIQPPGVPLFGATVAVTDGPSAGELVVTDCAGAFEVFAVSGDLRVIAMKDGYESLVQTVSVIADRTLTLELTPTGPPDLTACATYTDGRKKM